MRGHGRVIFRLMNKGAPISDDARPGSANAHPGDDFDSLQGSRRRDPAKSWIFRAFRYPDRRRRAGRPQPDDYYVLTRIKSICRVYLEQERAGRFLIR